MSVISDAHLILLRVLSAFIADLSFGLCWGALSVLLWMGVAASERDGAMRLLRVAGLVIVVIQPLQLWLLTVTISGAANFTQLASQIPDVLSTHSGLVIAEQFCSATALALFALPPLPTSIRLPCLVLALVFLTVNRSASGHAASDGSFSLRELSQFIHLVSTSAWAGGVMVVAWLFPRRGSLSEQYSLSKKLSRQATFAVGLIVISGAWNSWLGCGEDLSACAHSEWGLLLGIKLFFVLVAFGLGVRNRAIVRKEPSPSTMHVFANTLRAESVAMLLVLLFSAWLGNVSPV